MKYFKWVALTLLIAPVFSYAGACGQGKVTRILEGGWNSDDLMILIDYSKSIGEHSGTEVSGFIRFKKSSIPNRIDGIRAVALAAMMAGRDVLPYSHTNNCGDATELSVL